LFHLHVVALPISLYMRGAAVSGSIDPDIDTLATVLLTSLSVMTFHCTVRSHVTSVSPATLSLYAHGLDVPIPTFPPARILIFSVREPAFRVLNNKSPYPPHPELRYEAFI